MTSRDVAMLMVILTYSLSRGNESSQNLCTMLKTCYTWLLSLTPRPILHQNNYDIENA
jgi:hypothetical protein